jgi:hypothetical protein
MTHRPCPQCRTLNPTGNRTCARCGASFVTQTIIYSSDADAPYWVETTERVAPADLSHIGRAAALTAASVAAEVAFGYVERRFLRGQPVASAHARRLRHGALTTLTGAALMLAEQAFAVLTVSK